MDKAKGMTFTAESVQAILDGVKTQTRRVITPQPTNPHWDGIAPTGWHDGHRPMKRVPCQIGDIIYVRETWGKNQQNNIIYKADYSQQWVAFANGSKSWRSPMHMPKAAARIFLRVTDLRVERLQRISEADAIAEGIDSVEAYRAHWDKINGKREKGAYKWEFNPFVWVYEFTELERNEINADTK